MKYRTKVYEIEAVKFDGSRSTITNTFPEVPIRNLNSDYNPGNYVDLIAIWSEGFEEWQVVAPQAYVVKDDGEFYVVPRLEFEDAYEPTPS